MSGSSNSSNRVQISWEGNHDSITESILYLADTCDRAFSPPLSTHRSSCTSTNSSSLPSYSSKLIDLSKELRMSDSVDKVQNGAQRADLVEDDIISEVISSHQPSRGSSLSQMNFEHDIGMTDSATNLVKQTQMRASTRSHLQESQSASVGSVEGPGTRQLVSEENDPQDDPAYPSTGKTVIIMISLYISIFLVALDRTIVGPAIPAITNEFNSIGDIGWYGSSYMLTCAGFILLYGRLYTFFPTKPIFLSGIALFEAGSAVCGASQSSIMLIIGRSIAGLGSSGIFTGAILIMLNTVPLHRRPLLQGLFGACFGFASVAGPLLGGAFTGSAATWRWCFYINLPLGAVTFLVVVFLLKLDEKKPVLGTWKETFMNLDPVGTILFLPAIICLLLALEWGASQYSWSSPRVIACLVVFAVLFVAFLVWQYLTRNTTATVPTRILKQRSVAFGSASQFCVGATMLTFSIYIPLWFQAIKHASAMRSGVNTIPLVLSVVVGSILSGGLTQRIGYYTPFMVIGACLMSTGSGLITTWTMTTSGSLYIGYQIILGFGVGCTMQHPNIAVQVVLSKQDIPTGTAMLSLCQTLGGAVFSSVGQNLYLDKFSSNLEHIAGIDPSIVLGAGATDLTTLIPPALVPTVLGAYNHALTKGTFFAALIVACLSVPASLGMEWRSVKEKQKQTASAETQDEEKYSTPRGPSLEGTPETSTTSSNMGEKPIQRQEPELAKPVSAWTKVHRYSGRFSSYLTAKANPDLRLVLEARKEERRN